MSNECRLPIKALKSYLRHLINKVYKILPMKEEGCKTIKPYLLSLENELIGCYDLWEILDDNPNFTAIINIIEYLLSEQYDIETCKREVFKAIHLIEIVEKDIEKEG